MLNPPFQSVAKVLYDKGLSVIPLRKGTKKPFINGWQIYSEKLLPIEDLNNYIKGDYNIGLCLGKQSKIVAIDLDHDIENLHESIKKICGSSPLAKKGENGVTLFYRFNGEVNGKYSKNGEMVVEVLSTGNQTVLPPSIHPVTQKPYEYVGKSLEEIDINQLPFLPLDFRLKLDELFGKDMTTKTKVARPLSDTPLVELKEALVYLNTPEKPFSYDQWLSVGMALKGYDEEAFDLWFELSNKSGKHTEDYNQLQYKWESFKSEGVTVATIFKLAYDNGYKGKDKNGIKNALYKVSTARENIAEWKKNGYPVGDFIGIKEFEGKGNDIRWHLRKKELTVITGVPNSGKSEFLNFMVYNAAVTLDHKVLLFSFEDNIDRHIESFVTRHAGKNLSARSKEEEEISEGFVEEHFFFYDHTQNSSKLDNIVEVCKKIKEERGLDIVVIDPFSYLSSSYGCAESNLDHVKECLKELSRLCKMLDLHIFLIAHPKSRSTPKTLNLKDHSEHGIDLYSISGGAAFYNSCDNGMIIKREGFTTRVRIPKIRDQLVDNIGEFLMKYNRITRHFESYEEAGSNDQY